MWGQGLEGGIEQAGGEGEVSWRLGREQDSRTTEASWVKRESRGYEEGTAGTT
jgi:hypothetical protein